MNARVGRIIQCSPRTQRGLSLVELVISITVVSIAATSLLGVLSISTRGSADAMVRYQSVAIANAYLEEILLHSYQDPNCADGEAARSAFDDIDDYDGLIDNGARNQLGNLLAGLAGYRVSVDVVSASLGNPANVNALRVDVNVQDPTGVSTALSGYRTDPGVACVP